MNSFTFYPWQQQAAQQWLGADNQSRLAHAWLIHGQAGIGKRRFALACAAALLCEQPRHQTACGQCQACQWVLSGNHPDLMRIRPEALALAEGEVQDADATEKAAKKAPSKEIRVDQIRAIESWAIQGSHRGGWHVVVLYPAESLNLISANALLKILEEPPSNTIFLLVADAADALLPTLVSRCRRFPLAPPAADQARAWLQEQGARDPEAYLAASGGAPELALHWAQEQTAPRPEWLTQMLGGLAKQQIMDLGEWVEVLEKQPPALWIDALQRAVVDLMLIQAGLSARYYPDLHGNYQKLGASARSATVAELGKWLQKQKAIATHPLNAKLFAHDVLTQVARGLGFVQK